MGNELELDYYKVRSVLVGGQNGCLRTGTGHYVMAVMLGGSNIRLSQDTVWFNQDNVRHATSDQLQLLIRL
jgi:hypothetical protein